MIGKRGTHVGMVLSFVVFITFVIFLYDVLEPVLQRDREKENSLEYLKDRLVGELSEEVTIVTLRVNDDHDFANPCFGIPEGNIVNLFEGDNFVVKDEGGVLRSYNISGGSLRINSNKRFFRVHISEGFENAPVLIRSDCDDLGSNYSVGNVRKSKEIFISKALNLESFYNADYAALKKELELPLNVEFGFALDHGEGTITAGDSGNAEEVYIERLAVQYMGTEANLNHGNLTIRVW